MSLSRAVGAAVIAAGLTLGAGAGSAAALPGTPLPMKPGHGHDDWCPPQCGGGPDFQRGHWDGPPRGDKGPWWANNRHDWWDDRNGPPPWGWGPPPPVRWNGGPPPQFIDYWGYRASPVWDDGFRQWGIWLFGIWIPIFGIG